GSGRQPRQSRQTAGQPEALLLYSTIRVKVTPGRVATASEGTVMETEPAQCLNETISQEQKEHFRSDAGEETIQACYDLISSGQPLSEILVALKQLGPLDKQRQSERGL